MTLALVVMVIEPLLTIIVVNLIASTTEVMVMLSLLRVMIVSTSNIPWRSDSGGKAMWSQRIEFVDVIKNSGGSNDLRLIG